MIFLDNNATTKMADSVVDMMLPFLHESYGNPSAPYGLARTAAMAVEKARGHVANAVGVSPDSIIFTSGATEANNAALHSAFSARSRRRSVVVSAVEHASVLQTCEALSRRGATIFKVPVDRTGQLDESALLDCLDDRVAVVSLMGANNETGIRFDLDKWVESVHAVGSLFHSDVTQCVGKMPLNLGTLGVDCATLSAHKFHGPKGVGAMILQGESNDWEPWQRGGDQEKGRRGGTLNVPGIVGMGEAARLASAEISTWIANMSALRDRMEFALKNGIPGLVILGEASQRLPNTSSLHIPGLDVEALLARLDEHGICCSSGSACMVGSSEPSHVLEAMGFDRKERHEVIRISLSRFTNDKEIEAVVEVLSDQVRKTRAFGPALYQR